jgi:hypothetical protein
MAGLDPAIHPKPSRALQSRVDARLKAGHDADWEVIGSDRMPLLISLISCLQALTVSLATSKLYTRAVLPPAILACSSSGTPSRISARILRDWGNVDSLCG